MRTASVFSLAVLLIFLSKPLFAADPAPPGEPPTSYEARKTLIRNNLPLTEAEAKTFWPLYDAFEKKITSFGKRRNSILEKLGENFEFMTDDQARQTVHENLKLQSDRLKIMAQYFRELESVLPGKKLARYYQLEYHIRAIVDAKILERIPLIQ